MPVQGLMNHRCHNHELFYDPRRACKYDSSYADKARGNDRVDFYYHLPSHLCVHLHPGMSDSLLKNDSG
jgi:hypothetical protein